jgi:hypothetical protein
VEILHLLLSLLLVARKLLLVYNELLFFRRCCKLLSVKQLSQGVNSSACLQMTLASSHMLFK